MWSEGDVICVRQTWRGRVWRAHACYFVEEDDAQLVLFTPIGAEAWFPGIPIPQDDWTLKRSPFKENVLGLLPAGAGYSILLVWDAGWKFVEWYVNFERPPLQASPVGFDHFDLALDLVCYPDGRWELLDEDELEEGLERGVLTAEDEAAARANAERIVAEWPFPTGWEAWRPDPGWEPPILPAGWDKV